MRIFTVAMPKGGTTKTTTAAEIVAALARDGRRPLALDMDRQGNFASRLGVTADAEVVATAADVLAGHADAAGAWASGTVEGADVLAGTHELEGLSEAADVLAARIRQLATGQERDVVIDTRPTLSVLTEAALLAADVIVAPCSVEVEALDQLDELAAFITERVPGSPGIQWVIPTKYDARRVLDREILEQLQQTWQEKVTAPVRETVTVRESYLAGMPITLYRPASGVADDYRAACAPIIARHAGASRRRNAR